MKKTLTFPVLVVCAVLLCPSLVKLGQAVGISVGMYDPVYEGVERDTFNIGEDVRIIAESIDKPITITVLDPYGVVVHSETHDDYIYDDTVGGITEIAGVYTVEAASPADEVRENYACAYFKTIPEIPLGTIGVAATMLLGLGFYGLVRRKKYGM